MHSATAARPHLLSIFREPYSLLCRAMSYPFGFLPLEPSLPCVTYLRKDNTQSTAFRVARISLLYSIREGKDDDDAKLDALKLICPAEPCSVPMANMSAVGLLQKRAQNTG